MSFAPFEYRTPNIDYRQAKKFLDVGHSTFNIRNSKLGISSHGLKSDSGREVKRQVIAAVDYGLGNAHAEAIDELITEAEIDGQLASERS